jgi:hypothetical protein
VPHQQQQQQQQRVNATRNASFSRERDTGAPGVCGQVRDSANFEACRRQFPEQATSKLRTDSDSSCIVQGLSTQRCGSGQQQKMLSTTQQQSPVDNSVSQQQSSQQWENLQRTYQKHGMLPRQESPRDCSHVRDFQPIRDRNNSSSYNERQRTDDCHSLVASSEISATDQSDVTTSRHVTSDTSDTCETLYKVNTNANNRAMSTHSEEASEMTNKFLSLQSLDNDYVIKQTEVGSDSNVTSPPGKVKDAPVVSRLRLDEVDSETTGDEMMDGRNTEGEEDAASSISHDVILNIASDDASERSVVKPPSLNSSQLISSSYEESVDIVEKCVIRMTSATSLSSCSECDTVRDRSQVTNSQVDSGTDECQVTGSDTDAGDPPVVQHKLMTHDVNDVTVPSKPSSRLLPESLMSPSATLALLASSQTQCPPVSSLAPVTSLESPVTPVSDKLHSQSYSSQPVQQQRRQSVIRRLSVTGVTGRQGSEVKAVPPFVEEVVRLANTISHQPISLPPPPPIPSITVSVATKPVNNSAASAGLTERDTRTQRAQTNEAGHTPSTQRAQIDQSGRPGDTLATNKCQGHVADTVRTHQPPPTQPQVVKRRSVLDRLTVTDTGQDEVVPCDDTIQAAGKLGSSDQQDEDGRSDIASQIILQKVQAQGFSSVMSRFRASPLPSMTLNLSHPVTAPTSVKDILRSKHLQDDPLTFKSCQRTFADSLRGGVAIVNKATGQGQTVVGALSRDVGYRATSSTLLSHQPVASQTTPTKPQLLRSVMRTCQQLNMSSPVSATVDTGSVNTTFRSSSEERCVAPFYSQPMKVPSTSNINNNSNFTRQEFSIISGGPDTGIAAANQRTAAKLTGLTTKLSKLFPIEAEFEDNCSLATSVWEASSVGSVYSRGNGGDLGDEDEDFDSLLPVTCPSPSVTRNTRPPDDQMIGSSSSCCRMCTTLPVISRQTPPPLAASSRADTSVDRLTTINNVCERFMKIASSSRPASAVATDSTGSQTNTVGCKHGDSVVEDGDTLSEDDEVDRWVRDNLRGQGRTTEKMSRDAAADLVVAFDERLAQVCPDSDLDLVPVAASVSRHLRSQHLRHLVHSTSPLTRSLIHASSDNNYSSASVDL